MQPHIPNMDRVDTKVLISFSMSEARQYAGTEEDLLCVLGSLRNMCEGQLYCY